MSCHQQIEYAGRTLDAPGCTLGEGPTYDPHTGTAWWFDIVGKRLFECLVETGEVRSHELAEMSSVLARIDADRQLIVTETGLCLRQIKTGRVELISALEADNPVTRSNDGRVHACGALWIGTMGKMAEAGAGAIYHVARGQVTLLFPEISIPNAICFSPNGTAAYFADTAAAKLMRVEIDPDTALPTGDPKVFVDHSGGEGGLDGAICDRDGVVWNARWGAGSVDAYSPEGKAIMSLSLPASQASCPAFVGPNAERLLVTSARQGLTADQLATDPEAGQTFILDHPVRGRFEPDYIL